METKKEEDLKRALKEHEDLMRMIVHDLKGPLNEIISNIDVVNNNEHLREFDYECLETAITSCNTLKMMILDILDLGKIEDGGLRLRISNIDGTKLIQKTINGIKNLSLQKNIKVAAQVNKSPIILSVDENIISRVMANLLFNAIEHTKEGGEIKVSMELVENNFSKVTVTDNGMGIPDNLISKVFDKFVQIEHGGVYKRFGTGLGLTFCKMAVEAHGGIIGVNSIEGKGSTFYFTVPVTIN